MLETGVGLLSSPAVPIRAVIFDLFDTLVDLHMERLPPLRIGEREVPANTRALYDVVVERYPLPFERFAEALSRIDGEWRRGDYRMGIELPTTERFARLLREFDLEDSSLVEALTVAHMGKLREQARVLPHHAPILERLSQRAALGLCSNFSHAPTALGILEEAGLHSHFRHLTISVDLGIRKPRPEIFHAVLDQLGVGAAEAIHVGDNLAADVVGASEAGLRTVWITRRVGDPSAALRREPRAQPDWTIHHLEEIEEIVTPTTTSG